MAISHKLEEIRHFEDYLRDDKIPFLERYERAIRHLSRHVADISNIFLADLKHFYPGLWQTVADFRTYSLKVIEEYYKEGMKKGVFRKIDAGLLVLSDRFFLEVLSDPDVLIEQGLTLKKAFEQYFEMRFYGIVVR